MNTNEENNFQYEENMYNEDTRKENMIFGIVGAFLGSLIGVLFWVGIYALGYIAAISGLIMMVCSIKGYEIFAGKLSIKGIITSIIITVIMVYVATHISYGVDIYNAFKDTYEITLFDGIRSVTAFIVEEPDVKRGFIMDLLLGYFFTMIGAFSTVRSALSN